MVQSDAVIHAPVINFPLVLAAVVVGERMTRHYIRILERVTDLDAEDISSTFVLLRKVLLYIDAFLQGPSQGLGLLIARTASSGSQYPTT
jgi:hypothetical protein